jgi:antitoxin ParD1/3/4
MNINLGTQWEEFISSYVHSGRYLSASEVVREGLRLLQAQEQFRQIRLEQLRKEISGGVEQLEQGEYIELDAGGLKAHIAEVKARGRKLLARDKGSTKS